MLKVVRRRKGWIDPTIRRIQRCLCIGLQRDAWARPGLVVHTFNVDPKAKLVAQPARVFQIEIEKQIVKDVQKLLVVCFIKPIQHLWWLSNMVPVRKKNKQIWCYVDFRKLNRVCPNDEFPLPNMDLLIDSAIENATFSFMDEFSGYN